VTAQGGYKLDSKNIEALKINKVNHSVMAQKRCNDFRTIITAHDVLQ
jgi:hypothetical protein